MQQWLGWAYVRWLRSRPPEFLQTELSAELFWSPCKKAEPSVSVLPVCSSSVRLSLSLVAVVTSIICLASVLPVCSGVKQEEETSFHRNVNVGQSMQET